MKQNFTKTYYRTANCLTSDIMADFAPVSRVLGVDTSSGMGVLFTAMGTRFDLEYVGKEVFMATENYEADTRSIDDAPVAEVMRYVRGELVKTDKVPENLKPFVETILKGESVYKTYKEYTEGAADADILYLISPAADAAKNAGLMARAAEKLGKSVLSTNKFGDCGYLKLQIAAFDKEFEPCCCIKEEMSKHALVVTDDSYVLDALLIQYPECADKIQFVDAFIADNREAFGVKAAKAAVHESGVINRLYPERQVCYGSLLGEDVRYPERSGYDVTDSGLCGGLGLAYPENLTAIAARRMMDLNSLGADVIITPCACEAAGLNCAEKGTVKTLLEYVFE